jgi:CTP:molybdopterin cytidylyltransferase MocA
MGTAMVILAAGLSKRMGTFKPLLPVGDRPAILRSIDTAKAAGINEIIVVTGHKRGELEDLLRAEAPEARLIYNDDYHGDMFISVCLGVSALSKSQSGFFLLPADCCAITPGTLAALAESFTRTGASAVARPKYKGRRGHPPLVPTLYKDRLLSYGGGDGTKGFLATLPTVEIETDDPGILLDMDTPEDYVALLNHLGLSGPASESL